MISKTIEIVQCRFVIYLYDCHVYKTDQRRTNFEPIQHGINHGIEVEILTGFAFVFCVSR